jgi:hypothetical protein
MNYKGQTGVIGIWKGKSVFVLSKQEYVDLKTKNHDYVYVIEDDNCRMIHDGYVLGVLNMENGGVIEMGRSKYTPVVPKAAVTTSTTSFASGDVDYSKYSTVVDDFFKHLQDPIIVSD